tara:strand:+ start:74 stop:262 length:189 start_codon:yes stop_codon:yes gene_type:complete
MATIKYTVNGTLVTATGVDESAGVELSNIQDPEQAWNFTTECESVTYVAPYLGERPTHEERR